MEMLVKVSALVNIK